MYGIPLPDSSVFESDPITWNNGLGTYTAQHGFGSVPKKVTCFLVCKSSVYGYAIGDVIFLGLATNIAIIADSSVVGIRLPGTFLAATKNAASEFAPDSTYWDLKVIAEL